MAKNITIFSLISLFSIMLLSNKYFENKDNVFEYEINDSTKITINEVFSSNSEFPLYYYSNMNIPACNTGECKLIDITIFWDAFGNYFKYTVAKDAPLTKYNHEIFKKKEYIKLHKILNNPNSKYSRFTIENLTEKQATGKYKVDATSGSTIKLIFDTEKISGAVKTTHTLWHIANGDIKSVLEGKTKSFLKNKKEKNLYSVSYGVAYKIYNKESQEFNFDFFTDLEKEITKTEMEKSILISNYLLRNKIKSKKANKLIKHINFIK